MENASKALIMAGGVLIGVLILSLAVYLFTTFGATSERVQEDIELQRIVEFNAQFTKYEGKKVIIHDIITLANLAKENNNYYEGYTDYENSYKIDISIKSYRNKLENNEEEILNSENGLVYNDDGTEKKYTGTITYHDNGRIATMLFEGI